MNANIVREHLALSKMEELVIIAVTLAFFSIFAVMNIGMIADFFGIPIAADWYRTLTDWLAAGGTLTSFAAVVMGVTLPAWLATAAMAFGVYAA